MVDTHTFIWALLKDPRLSKTSKQILTAPDRELVFSMVSLWEASIKIKLGKLQSVGSSIAYLRAEMNEYGMELLPIRFEHLLQLETLPPHHGDPFDRLLIAQAIVESLPILTEDAKFKPYAVKLLW